MAWNDPQGHKGDAPIVRGAIFDLDGTLLDTIRDIADSMNRTLGRFGYPGHGIEGYKQLVGEGVETMIRKCLAPAALPDAVVLDRMLEDYRAEYLRRMTDATRAYPGIVDLIDALLRRGIRVSVLSNKKQDMTQALVSRYFPGRSFAAVFGARDGVPHKPDPAAAFEVAALMGVEPADCVFVGDSGIDMETARRAGMIPVGVLWGFRARNEIQAAGARYLVESPEEFWPALFGAGLPL